MGDNPDKWRCTVYGKVVSFRLRPFQHQEKTADTDRTGRWVGPGMGLDALQKSCLASAGNPTLNMQLSSRYIHTPLR
jgi:hypothetical protein